MQDAVENVLLPTLTAKAAQALSAPVVGSASANYLRVRGETGARWRVRLSPADSVLPSAPEGDPAPGSLRR